jgi:hypothetical protein
MAKPAHSPGVERIIRLKKVKQAFSSFDLTNGLTFQEMEDIPAGRGSRLYAFVFLLGALWLVWALRKPGGQSP